MEKLTGKCVVLGVSGGIAAYKMANVASALRKAGANVHVIMTENAAQFITPLTFETLTNNRCVVDTFARDFQYDVKHISLAKAADLFVIAPATANVIAKLAHGIADDMLTTTVLAAKCPKLVAPAMNTGMLETPSPRITSVRWSITALRSSSRAAACSPARTWAAGGCRSRRSFWTALPTSSPGRRIWPDCASPSPPVPPRRRWTRCAI